ncbi:Uncharacterised protein [Enterobacter asburiae]|uniref:Uncharacterized protein n=1 Tax=Enterobacter asburiae TaxID=61645 RepID=A0A376FIU8_ENTAS|nr:Uncharacterised protein [Enterobacter asburiae]
MSDFTSNDACNIKNIALFMPAKKVCQPDDQAITHCPGNDSKLLIVFYVQIMPDDFIMQLHRF